MKKILLPVTLVLFFSMSAQNGFSWGQTGHRVIGKVASQHLSKKTRKALSRIMEHESLAVASTWMDEIRSDPDYDYMIDWHWVTIPDDTAYGETDVNPKGDIIETLERLIGELERDHESMPLEKQREYIRILTHLVGDIHQPLHVGTGDDRGGNAIRVVWFWDDSTNLHSVWDSKMIASKEFSYTELAEVIDHTSKSDIEKWQSASVREWAYESMTYRQQLYDIPDNGQLNYVYLFKNWDTVQLRLHKAGIRLAGVLNAIYG